MHACGCQSKIDGDGRNAQSNAAATWEQHIFGCRKETRHVTREISSSTAGKTFSCFSGFLFCCASGSTS